jgi:hypothetical protein
VIFSIAYFYLSFLYVYNTDRLNLHIHDIVYGRSGIFNVTIFPCNASFIINNCDILVNWSLLNILSGYFYVNFGPSNSSNIVNIIPLREFSLYNFIIIYNHILQLVQGKYCSALQLGHITSSNLSTAIWLLLSV